MKHVSMRSLFAAASVAAFMMTSGTATAAECSAENWKACKGKPWVDGDVMDTPLGSKWWPNKMWGADDEAGSTNWYTKPEVIARALAANSGKGKVYKLGHPYTVDMPMFGARKFSLRIAGFLPALSTGSAAIKSLGTTNSWPPKLVKSVLSSTAWAISVSPWVRLVRAVRCVGTTVLPVSK